MSANPSPDRLRICFRNRADAAGFTVAPNVVLDDSGLPVQVRFAYIQLRRHAWQDPATTVSQGRLAELCGVSSRQVRAYLSTLVAARLISVETGRRDGTTNRYWIEPLTARYGEDFGQRRRQEAAGQRPRLDRDQEGGRNSTSYPPRNSTSYPGRKPTSYNKDAVDEDSAPPPPTPPDQAASPAPSRGAGEGGGSTRAPKASEDQHPIAVDDAGLRVQLAGEGFNAEVVGEALRELALTKAGREVRHPLRYCLSVARRLERERAATQASAAAAVENQARLAAAREASAAFGSAVDAALARLSAEQQDELRASVLEQLTSELGFAPPTHGPLLRGAMRLAVARRNGLAPPEEVPEEIAELVGR